MEAGSGGAHALRLLDRDDDLAAIEDALSAAAAGAGSVLVIEGPAGIGKTALLKHLRGRALDLGMAAKSARGGELERGFGFGIVRQLLETAVLGADAAERERLLTGAAQLAGPVFTDVALSQEPSDIAFATLHGLYWLVVNMAERAPLVLIVDDAQWADEPSLRFLLHLAPRLQGLRILVALAARTGAEGVREDLRALILVAGLPALRPRPLGEAAVASLVRANLGAGATDQLCRTCADATGGNPFLLAELLGEFRREGRAVADIDPSEVGQLVPERISHSVLLRVRRLGAEASAVARSAAVLGDWARISLCADLIGLDVATAAGLAGGLADIEVLTHGEPLRFVHPIVRAAVYEDMSIVERADLHARAARLLTRQRCQAGVIATHLLATTPAADQGVVAILREAARTAITGGAPDTAAVLLRRALDEPPSAADRPLVLFEIGNAEYELGDPSATRHLTEAIETADDPLIRAKAVTALAWTNHPDARSQRAQLPFYERVAAEIASNDRELELQLEGARLGALLLNPDLEKKFETEAERFSGLPSLTRAECLIRSFVARRALEGGPVAVAGDLAEEAAAHPALVSEGGHPLWRTNVTICLMEAERYEVAEHILTRAIRHAERMGSPQWLARALWLRGLVRHRRGDLRAAEVDGRAAVDIHGSGAHYTKVPGLVVVIDTLADQGRTAEGEELLLDRGMDAELTPTLFSVLPLLARGRMRAVAGHHQRARDDLTDALRRIERSRGMFPWASDARVALAPVLLALGDQAGARSVAEDGVAAAEIAQSPRRMGGALRVRGLSEGGKKGLESLRQATEILADSPALLWRAEAMVDYGIALRLAGQRTSARPVLRAGLDLAHRCGAAPLADRAAEEMRAAGGRPRRRAAKGADALTAGERRVAELAAEGVSNKEIAQSLFVTLRTVEMHLSNTYSKLGIRSRQELAAALRQEAPDH
ncbi:helix-turn-helix transcriptional regulator [Mycolicibacterium iranicum]|uniref:AAA family ATPase n=1 Tax=Mycolicibacterium iranicum TaxID=912594 RepID=A0ABT4HAG1_MYCIR|nr:AAA family ATPase [Mycolicibacterium iranicum]MCZ0727156.1 AAA family ATPase [Mycolicibacterium iranicum]